VNTRKRRNKRSFRGINKWKKKEKEKRTNGLHLIPRYVIIEVPLRIPKDFVDNSIWQQKEYIRGAGVHISFS
jgi:hypothetical protein